MHFLTEERVGKTGLEHMNTRLQAQVEQHRGMDRDFGAPLVSRPGTRELGVPSKRFPTNRVCQNEFFTKGEKPGENANVMAARCVPPTRARVREGGRTTRAGRLLSLLSPPLAIVFDMAIISSSSARSERTTAASIPDAVASPLSPPPRAMRRRCVGTRSPPRRRSRSNES